MGPVEEGTTDIPAESSASRGGRVRIVCEHRLDDLLYVSDLTGTISPGALPSVFDGAPDPCGLPSHRGSVPLLLA